MATLRPPRAPEPRISAERAFARARGHGRARMHVRRVAVHVEVVERDEVRTALPRSLGDAACHGEQELWPLEIQWIDAVVDALGPIGGAGHRLRVAHVGRDDFDAACGYGLRRLAHDADAMTALDERLRDERSDLSSSEHDVQLTHWVTPSVSGEHESCVSADKDVHLHV